MRDSGNKKIHALLLDIEGNDPVHQDMGAPEVQGERSEKVVETQGA